MSDSGQNLEPLRCPYCDSVVRPGAGRCLMCGKPLPKTKATLPPVEAKPEPVSGTPTVRPIEPPLVQPEPPIASVEPAAAPINQPPLPPEPEPEPVKPTATAKPPEVKPPISSAAATPSTFTPRPMPTARGRRRALPTNLIFGVVLVLLVILAVFVIPYSNGETQDTEVAAAATSTLSVIPTFTPTITLIPTETSAPTAEPTATLTPAPTATLQPPQNHVVQAGETLFTLGFRYNVSADSIAELNGLGDNANIIINQTLLVPWPTATPPLEPVLVEIDGQYFAADASACCQSVYHSGRGFVGGNW